MDANEVVAVLTTLADAGVDSWLCGGWGIDALLGERTRHHHDLDIGIWSGHEPAAMAALAADGFTMAARDDLRPVRFVMRDSTGRTVEVYPLDFEPDGSATQANMDGLPAFRYPATELVSGVVGGFAVQCISAELQLQFHLGYEPSDIDRSDMDALHDRLGLTLEPPYA